MARLDGSGRPVSLGYGITVRAPGLRGTATAHDIGPGSPTRAPDVDASGPALAKALADQGLHRIRVIDVTAGSVPVPGGHDVRAPTTGAPGLEVQVPDLGPDTAQVILAVDENGVATWNFPVDNAGSLTPTRRGSGGSVRFVIPAFAAPTDPAPHETPGTRGILGFVGKKILELITIPFAEIAVPPLARAAAKAWETNARRCRVRAISPQTYRSGDVPDLDAAGWGRLAMGRSLWFVHGTFSTSEGGFGGLPEATMAALCQEYGDRVVAFDHFTLGVDPVGNVAALRELMPDGLDLAVDLVSHSRGGLVSRALAGAGGTDTPLDVRRIVHVATPNHGTALASPANVGAFIDRVTTLINLVPGATADVIAAGLSSVLVVVKVIAQYGLVAIPGLASMDIAGGFLAGFNATDIAAEQYAVAADYTPAGGLQALLATVGNVAVDQVFESTPNDLVVPTAGVYDGDALVHIPAERRLVLPKNRAVFHGSYFNQEDVATTIGEWLSA
jgi:hypothetical protein